LEDPGIDGRIILKWIFRKWDIGKHWIDLARNRDKDRNICECGNEPSGSVKCGEFTE